MFHKGNQWQTLSSKKVYTNQYLSVYEDNVIKPDGKKGIYGWIKVRPTVGIVPVDKDNNVFLCRQSRYLFKGESWEIPRGFVDNGESILDAAKRELAEEAGLFSNNIIQISSLRLSIGISSEECIVYLARDLKQVKDFHIQKDEIKEIKKFSLFDTLSMIKHQKIQDGLTIGGVLTAKEYLLD